MGCAPERIAEALGCHPQTARERLQAFNELTVPDPQGEVEWTVDALTVVARQHGIQVAQSQVRRIFRQEGVRWRRTRFTAR